MDGLMVLEKIYAKKKGKVALIYPNESDNSVLVNSWWFQAVKEDGFVFASVDDASNALLKNQQQTPAVNGDCEE